MHLLKCSGGVGDVDEHLMAVDDIKGIVLERQVQAISLLEFEILDSLFKPTRVSECAIYTLVRSWAFHAITRRHSYLLFSAASTALWAKSRPITSPFDARAAKPKVMVPGPQPASRIVSVGLMWGIRNLAQLSTVLWLCVASVALSWPKV